MATTEKRTVEIIMDGKQPSSTLKGLNADIKTLNKSIRDLPAGSKEFEVQAKKMRELQKEYQGFQQKVNFAGQSLQYFKSQLKAVAIGTIGGNLITGIGQAITSQISGSIKYMADLSDELANIRKTTGLSAQGVDELNRSLSQIDTRTSKKNLREIAVGLGQVGEAANIDNIRALDTVAVALGDEFGTSAQEITNTLSILRNNLTDFKTGNYADDILKIGNALNVLGASGLATAPVVVDFANRMAGTLTTNKVTAGQILGISAAMQELGVNAELGGTAFKRLIDQMTANPEIFAKVAGAKTNKEIKDFIKLINTDAVSALLKVAKGAREAGKENTEYAKVLALLNTDGSNSKEIFAKLANSQELFTTKINEATEGIKNNNSINQEFALLNENNAAKIEKLKKSFNALIESDSFNAFLTKAINGTITFIRWVKEAGEWVSKNIYIFKAIGATILTYVAAVRLATIWQARKILLDKAEAFGVNLVVTAIKAAIVAEEVLTGKIALSTVAMRVFNTVAKTNPFIFLATAIVGATVALNGWMSAQREAAKIQLAKHYDDEIKKITASSEKAIRDLDAAFPDASKLTKKQLDENTKIIKEKILQQREVVLKEAAETKRLLAEQQNNNFITSVSANNPNAPTDKYIFQTKKNELQKTADKKALELQVAKTKGETAELKKLQEINQNYLDKKKEINNELVLDGKKTNKQLTDDQKKYNEEIDKLLNDVVRAKIEAIEEQNARELLFLQKDLEDKEAQINQEIDAQKKLAIELGKGTAVLKKLEEDRSFLLLGVREKGARERAALIDKQKKETDETAYKKDIDAITQKFEVEKLLEKQLYAEGKSSKEKYDAQIQDLDRQKYVELLAIARKYGKSENEIQQAIADYDIKIAEDRSERIKRALLNEAEVRLRLANLDVKANKINSFDAIRKQYEAETNLLTTKLATELGVTELNEQNIFDIKKQFSDQFAELDQQYADERQSKIQSIIDGSVNAFQNLFGAITDALNQQIQSQIDMIEKQKEAELNSLEERKNKKLIYEDEYAQKKDEITKKSAAKERELKHKQAVLDKTTAIFNIALSTAQAIMSAAAAPWPASIAFQALAATVGAVQLAFAIAKPIPYAKGGKFLGDVMQGPTHADGGMPVINPTTGKVVAELEGGEPILSKKTYENNRDVVDSLLYVSQNENGRKIKLPNYYKSPPTFAYGGIIGAYQSTTMARAGNITNNYSTITESANNEALLMMVQKQGEMIEKFSKKLDEPLFGVWDYDYFQKSNAIIDRAKKIGNVG